MSAMTCWSCRYYYPNHGECRRYPPALTVRDFHNGSVVEPGWPKVQAVDWCGEWLEKPLATVGAG